MQIFLNKAMVENLFTYQLVIKGRLNHDWCDWLEGDSISQGLTVHGLPVTRLIITLPDQSAMMGVLMKLHTLNFELLLVRQLGIELEDKK